MDHSTEDGRTALMTACVFGHELCARALLEAGADVDHQNNDGATALVLSCQDGHEHSAPGHYSRRGQLLTIPRKAAGPR